LVKKNQTRLSNIYIIIEGEDIMVGIYKITNKINGKIYIG
jgi:hypothetical protein